MTVIINNLKSLLRLNEESPLIYLWGVSILDQIVEDKDPSRFEYRSSEIKESEDEYIRNCLRNPEYELIYEKHCWEYVRCFVDELPSMNEEDGYLLLFKVNENKQNRTAFANTIIGICVARNEGKIKIGCTVADPDDGLNHFWLIRYPDNE